MTLKQWAIAQGVHPQTAYRWFREGRLPIPAVRVGTRTILVNPEALAPSGLRGVGIYARVSSHDQRGDLVRQVARLREAATGFELPVVRVESEVGSGLSGDRRKLCRLLADPQVEVVLVERRDRLCRFGVEYVEAALAASGRRLQVVDSGEVEGDFVREMIEVLTSFCARRYGRGSARLRAQRALKCAARDPGDA